MPWNQAGGLVGHRGGELFHLLHPSRSAMKRSPPAGTPVPQCRQTPAVPPPQPPALTTCFLGLPRGRLPLLRFCTSFSCSLKEDTA